VAETEFERELEIFRTDEEAAQQAFFCWLSFRYGMVTDTEVHRAVNVSPLFWRTTHHAMLLSAFITLGRTFDQDSHHNLDLLVDIFARDVPSFSKDALRQRKELVISAEDAARYVEGKHELTSDDVRLIKKQIAVRRSIYQERYRAVRDQFAHHGLPDLAQREELFAKTNIEEMKDLFGFLYALHDALWEAFQNGFAPVVKTYKFILPPDPPIPGRRLAPGERIFREGTDVLKMLATAPPIVAA
jgi:hypothetical protein